MSLQVWLPLNGNLNNQGLSNIILSNSISYDNNGKIGKCGIFTSQLDTTLPASNWDYISNNCSFGAWIKISKTELQNIANSKTFDTTNSSLGGTLLGKDSYGGLALRWKTNNLSSSKTITQVVIYGHIRNTSSNSQTTNNYTIPFDTWTHVILTINRITQIMSLYINGELFNEKNIGGVTGIFSTGNFLICQSSWDGGNGVSSSGKWLLNDVRIYDHALSPKEVKEISKGLVLHYKMNDQCNNTNIINLISLTNQQGAKTTNLIANTTSYGLATCPSTNVEAGQTYLWSVELRCIQNSNKLLSLGVDTNASGGSYTGNDSAHTVVKTVNGALNTIKNGDWATFYCITTMKSDATNGKIFHSIYGKADSDTTVIFEWRNMMLVKSAEVIPFISQTDTIVYNSGIDNFYNGTIINKISIVKDAKRYEASCKFNSTSSKIKLPAFNMSGFANSYTFSWWQKNTTNNNMPWGFSDGNRLNLYHTTNLCLNTGDSGNNPFKNNGTAVPQAKLCDSNWHHCVIIGNGTDTRLYIDGELAGIATTYKSLTGTQIYISGWDTGTNYTFNGSNINDFRIYATALSAEDVKELYNTSVTIDNVGNEYERELQTYNTNKEIIPTFGDITNISSYTNEKAIINGHKWAATDYIKINPNSTFTYDIIYSNQAGKQLYVGFERYDANKTATSNQSCTYVLSTSDEANKKRITGTVNLKTDSAGSPTDTIKLRILTDWNNSSSTAITEIYSISLREGSVTLPTKITKTGILLSDDFREGYNASIRKNGFTEANNFYEY